MRNDDDRSRPIKIDTTSNGEFVPVPLSRRNRHGNALADDRLSENAARCGRDRRRFVASAAGAATALLAINEANALAGVRGGYFVLPEDAAFDSALAELTVGGNEFIFDVQGHFVDPAGAWVSRLPKGVKPFSGLPSAVCHGVPSDDLEYLQCVSGDAFIKDVFLDSDTDVAVLSFVPSTEEGSPLTIAEAARVRDVVDQMKDSHRLLLHGRVNPNQPGDVERMDELAEKWQVVAWKAYTQWGPNGAPGFYLDDAETGIPFIEKARALGIRNIAVHKGLPFGRRSYEHSQCRDIGVVAKRYPEVNFLVYHSGFETQVSEQAFAEGRGRAGVDTLVQSVIDNGVGPNANVYAELGSTWRFLMRDPEQAAHVFGKLLKYIGEDNILWGTDSIWYGSPQDQIQAFRSFQIGETLREKYGYPEITSQIRAKIFGLNAARPYHLDVSTIRRHATTDTLGRVRQAYRQAPNPHFHTYGPKTRREFLRLKKLTGDQPG